jgi:hypothetical protein
VEIQLECPRRGIDRQWNILLRFCDFANIGDLLASEFDSLKNRVFSEDVTEGASDKRFVERWQEDFEWWHERFGRSVPHCRALNLTVEFAMILLRQLQRTQNWI